LTAHPDQVRTLPGSKTSRLYPDILCDLLAPNAAKVSRLIVANKQTVMRWLQQRRFQFQKGGQQFVGSDNVTPTVSPMGVNGPAPAIARDCTAIAPGPTGSTELVSDYFPILHWRHDARWNYSYATRCERFRYDHAVILADRSKAAGKRT